VPLYNQNCVPKAADLAMIGKRRFLLLGALLLANCGNALDLVLTRISCDSTLPVSVARNQIALTCNGKKQCTFGELATLQGQLQYQQVKYLDLDEGYIVYITAHFDISVDFVDIADGSTLSLCNDRRIKPVTERATCPSDGRYNLNTTFYLPYYSDSWWATGWHASGQINLYADMEEQILIGSCELFYTTKVTSSSRFFHAPSAAVTVTVAVSIVGIFLVFSLFHTARDFYCVWKEDHLELHCGRKCCPADRCFCGQDDSDNDDDDDVYYMEYDEHGEPVKPAYQLSDLPRGVNNANDDNICQLDNAEEEDDEESGGDDCAEDGHVYHLEEDAGGLPPEPKEEEKLPPNIKTPKDLLSEPKKYNPKAKTSVFRVWYIPPAAPCQNVCGVMDDVL
jgi:hypothetical protein